MNYLFWHATHNCIFCWTEGVEAKNNFVKPMQKLYQTHLKKTPNIEAEQLRGRGDIKKKTMATIKHSYTRMTITCDPSVFGKHVIPPLPPPWPWSPALTLSGRLLHRPLRQHHRCLHIAVVSPDSTAGLPIALTFVVSGDMR
jgi:hypothetical protein